MIYKPLNRTAIMVASYACFEMASLGGWWNFGMIASAYLVALLMDLDVWLHKRPDQ